MFADDAIHLVLWMVKGLNLRNSHSIMSLKKTLVIGTRISAAKKKEMRQSIQKKARGHYDGQ